MAWPKKGTRELVIDNQNYLWHYDAHCPLCSTKVFTIGRPGQRFVLFIDPYPWGFELKPASVVSATRWALEKGWTPESGPTRAMAWSDKKQEFEWLADGQRHLSCKSKPNSQEQAIKKYGRYDGLDEWKSIKKK
jgi:hypothetical protein